MEETTIGEFVNAPEGERATLATCQIFLINRDPEIVVYANKINDGAWDHINPISANCNSADPLQCKRDGHYDFLCNAPRDEPNVAIWILYRKNGGKLNTAYWSAGTIASSRAWADIPPGRLP